VTTTDTTRDVVLRYLGALARGDRDVARTCIAEDAVWDSPPSMGSGRIVGRTAIFDKYFAVDEGLFETGTSSYDLVVEATIVEGERAAVELLHRARTVAGEPFETRYCVVFTVRDGEIVAAHEHLDTLYFSRVFAR
jgi:uncharacterized protein